jgi:LacI family transcriptional regulator
MVSLKDIAQATGVSVRTVSRALKDNGYVADDVRRRVQAEADRLGYRPNLAARSLRTGQSHEIGVVMTTTDELHMAKLAAMELAFREAGFGVQVTFDAGEQPTDRLGTILRLQPAGVVLFGRSDADVAADVARLSEAGIPHMCVDAGPADIDAVRIDREQGVCEAVAYLLERGRRRVAYLGPEVGGRLSGYRRAMRAAGQPERVIPTGAGGCQFEAGQAAAERMLQQTARVDAVQVYTDVMAAGVLDALHRRGLRVPEDVAVVGFDDRQAASLMHPPLTTVAQPNQAVGRAVAERLLAKIHDEDAPADGWSVLVSTELVVRASA